MTSKSKIVIVLVIVILVFGGWVLIKSQNKQKIPDQNLPPISPTSSLESNNNQIPNNNQVTKTYKNTEFGFEFEYPKDWVVKENTFGSYYSKFNLEVLIKKGEYLDLVFDVNIVLPEFPDRSFKNIEKITSEVIVNGVPGIKYQYEFEEQQETAIILPLGEYKMILGTDSKQDVDSFNQILASFKFLK